MSKVVEKVYKVCYYVVAEQSNYLITESHLRGCVLCERF
nr:MAG TPA: hypothetical protein [Caudoviricetes sp.]